MTSDELRVHWACRRGVEPEALAAALVAEVWGVGPGELALVRCGGVPWVRIGRGGVGAGGAGAAPDAEGRWAAVSLSSSHGLGVGACLGPGAPETATVGVDAEERAPFLASGACAEDFAEVVLAPAELRWFRASARAGAAGSAAPLQLDRLLCTWVRKEAVMKALHTGLDTARGGVAPQEIVVSPPWDEPACLSHPEVRLTDHEAEGSRVLVSTAVRFR
ncbi:4'-phosphopantetheinyl transferase superfamily protein [Brevibacterium album]|uniref:4'-phosphopantetheinyl transferase superfamily protein n=1 Tax=Brevibacterium album TaxID=417948 RepID=UPI00040C10B4|nr:4'-phosphopantetheinyl transferase superfamily protein [Brevibacterium album]